MIGSPIEPPPDPGEFVDFENFIREKNNVTWRNFNVVNNDPSPSGDPSNFIPLPFLAPGAPDKARQMRLEIVAKLPRGARVFLEAPPHFVDGLKVFPPFFKVQKKQGVVQIPINPHGRHSFDEMLFPAKSRTKLRLLVQIPKELRGNPYEVFARQLYREQEVGRVTWRLVPPEFFRQREERHKKRPAPRRRK